MSELNNYLGGALLSILFAVVQSIILSAVNRKQAESAKNLAEYKAIVQKLEERLQKGGDAHALRLRALEDELKVASRVAVSKEEFAQALGGWRAENAELRRLIFDLMKMKKEH